MSQERYGPHLKSRPVSQVFDTRPALAEDVIWLTRSEFRRALKKYDLSPLNDELTVKQIAGIETTPSKIRLRPWSVEKIVL